MRIAIIALALAFTSLAQASSFRYREFVPAAQDCAAELVQFKQRFETQTGLKVIDSNCAPISAEQNSASLIYESSREVRANTIAFGHGLGSMDSVALAGDIGGSYESLGECQADLATQTKTFMAETGASPVAAYCTSPSSSGLRYNMQIDSFEPLAKRLYLFEAFRNFGTDESRKRAGEIVAAQGVTVARSFHDWIFFYDTTNSKRGSESPAHMNARSISAGMFASAEECNLQQPRLVAIMQAQGFANFAAECTGGTSFSTLELIASDRIAVNTYVRSDYASLAECNADAARLEKEARKQHGFIGGYCTYQSSIDPQHSYGYQTLFR